jgi:uncharacterized membrane protein YcaP (DUF421 family)
MLTIFLRSVILFLLAVVFVRIMGKRQVGQLQPLELVVAIMIANLAVTPMADVGTPLLYGIVPMMGLVVIHGLFAITSMKSQKLRAFYCGTPTVLIKNGVIQVKELEKLCVNLNDLLEELRTGGVLNPSDVDTAIMETSGKVSVFPKPQKRPATPEDLSVATGYEGIPLTLILDGTIEKKNLDMGKIPEEWLFDTLKLHGFGSPKEVLLCSLDTSGKMFLQGRQVDQSKLVDAVPPNGIGW